ncbi:hypothetical protein Pla110_38790 [Polystyrenella longa]|uniref:Right handed beta helix domain-containing protein n=1 Tax=Polystyrenella longa TaxID=2528007 RepID=A0A518CSG0_9PLAN|nr:right-handed parallel beta-helix repeat-containing protein [Polystyrenella longa]QDU82124.1 hypothetical protein Pla110_38790 [Polystyrenella longa]
MIIKSLSVFSIILSCTLTYGADLDVSTIGKVSNSTLTLHPGEQQVHGRVVIPPTIDLIKGSKDSVLRFEGLTPKDGECLGTLVRSHSRLTIKDLTIIGDHDGLPLGPGHQLVHGLAIRMVEDVTIANVTIKNVAGMGINLSGCTHILVRNCTIKDVGRDGVTSYGRSKSELKEGQWIDSGDRDNRLIEKLTVIDNHIENVGDDGIACWLSSAGYYTYHGQNQNVTIANNTIVGVSQPHAKNFGRGIALGGVRQALLAKNKIIQMPTHGIYVGIDMTARFDHERPARSSEEIKIIDNLIVNTGRYQGSGYMVKQAGIYLEEVDQVLLKRNTISGIYKNRDKPKSSGMGIIQIESENVELDDNTIVQEMLPYTQETP